MYFKEKTKDADEKLHAGMCEHAGEECRKGDSEVCRTACNYLNFAKYLTGL